jgi:hypothetical protein
MILRPSGVMNLGSVFEMHRKTKNRHSSIAMTMVVTQPSWGVDLPPPTNPRDLRYKYSAGGFNVLPACLVFMTVGMKNDDCLMVGIGQFY